MLRYCVFAYLPISLLIIGCNPQTIKQNESGGVSGGISAEQRCYGMVQNKVAWSTNGQTVWQDKNVKSLCQGVRAGQEQARINCFSNKMPSMGWSAAINTCKSGAVSNSKIHSTPTPVGQTAEQRCYDMVQNKVAWSTNGQTAWQDKNVKSLCQGVRTGQEQARINCFSNNMPSKGWSAAINTCKSGSATPVATPPKNQKQTITFKNKAGYVAKMIVMYMVNQKMGNGYAPVPKTEVTGNLAVGQSKTITLPANIYKEGQINVWIEGVGTTTKRFMSKVLSPHFIDNACYETKGTIFNASGDYCDGGAPLIKSTQNSDGKSAEQRCYGMVQNKVAWNTKGDKRWQDNNVKSLCQGVKTGLEQSRIVCFSGVMPVLGWSEAIKQCKK